MTRSGVVAALVFAALAGAARAEPLDTALAAMTAEEKAPLERVRLFVQRGDVIDLYYIDRLRPDRTYLLKNPRQNGGEAIVIGDQQWVRDAGGWQRSAMAKAPDVAPAMADLLRQGLSEAVETEEAGGGRLVEGKIAWANASRCDGRLRLRLDGAGLPSTLSFEGTCGSLPTKFVEAFSFKGPLTIEPPE